MIAVMIMFVALTQAMPFKQWVGKYNKKYTPAEFIRRRAIFMENARYVDLKRNEISFKMSVDGPFAAMTREEFKMLNKGTKEVYDKEHMATEQEIKEMMSMKKDSEYGNTIDYRKHMFRNYVTPVGDQLTCDTGYVFAAASLLESKMLLTYSFLNANKYSVSKGELMTCTKDYDSSNKGCDGGSVVALLKYMKEKGVGAESSFPYTINDENTSKCSGIKKIAKVVDYKTYEAADSSIGIVATLTSYGPVVAHLDALDLQFYDEGILEGVLCDSTETTQSVLIVGYGSEKGQDYFVCKNSWGEEWGEDGYFRIVASGNNCGLTKYVTYLTSVKSM